MFGAPSTLGVRVGQERWHGARSWLWALIALMVAISILDLLFADINWLVFLVIPIAGSAMVEGPRWTLRLVVLALLLTVVTGIAMGHFASIDGWLQLAAITLSGVLAVMFSRMLETWRTQLERSEDEFRLLAENASDIVARIGVDRNLEWVSPSVAGVLGWDPSDLVGTQPWELIHPDDQATVALSLGRGVEPGRLLPAVEARFRKSDGSYVWMLTGSSRAPDGRYVVSYRLVDDEVRARQALLESETTFRLLAENSLDLVFSMDNQAVLQWVSPSATRLLGYAPVELIGQSGDVLIHPQDLPILLEAATDARSGEPAVCRIRMLSKSGEERWVEATPRALRDDSGELMGGVVGVRDIHDEVRTQRALQHEVDFDGLTGLAKRAVALARIDEILDSREESDWALICVGVDGLTSINHAYTYAAGDEILKVVAERLVEAAGAADRVARIAGDEFAVTLSDIVSVTDAADAADRLLSAVRGPVVLGEVSVDISGCAGIALARDEDAQELLRDATAAMRQASKKGSDRWEFLDGNVGEDTRRVLEVQKALRLALSHEEIESWLMPIVNLRGGTLVGYEALVRWRQADGTVLAPDGFLDVAERTGLIVAIDREVLSQSLEILATLPSSLTVGVNVSASSLASEGLFAWILNELDRTGISPARLHLEVTETDLFELTDAVRGTMRRLADAGISWWVDDFGTGFSSISHLRDLPISGLKLDRSFTAGLTLDDSHATRLAKGLAGLAQGLGLLTIAEGVETPEQAQVLAGQGWDLGQGWLYGKAVPVAR